MERGEGRYQPKTTEHYTVIKTRLIEMLQQQFTQFIQSILGFKSLKKIYPVFHNTQSVDNPNYIRYAFIKFIKFMKEASIRSLKNIKMNNKEIITISLCWLLGMSAAVAQINPPNLICASTLPNGDVTLTWEIPTNTCGTTFNGYRIFVSSDPTAPFVLLDIVTDPLQTTYTHTGANGGNVVWYYYMTTDLICPDEVPAQSNVLDNNQPAVTEIDYVTVNANGNVELRWFENTSPETFGYVIYREEATGFVVVDTVFGRGNTSFIDTVANPNLQPERYTIVSVDRCGNTSLINNEAHQTILLDASIDRCTRQVTLSWSPYDSWSAGVRHHQIWVSRNGGSEEFIDFIGDTTQYIYNNAMDGDELCFHVRAVQAGSSTSSASNRICVQADVVQPMSYIYMTNVTVDANNQVQVEWTWDADADIQNYAVQRADSINNYSTVSTQGATNIQSNNTISDTSANASATSYRYRVVSTDSCGETATSNYGSTIFLSGVPSYDFSNELSWTYFDLVNATVQDYTIYRIIDGIEEAVATVDFLTKAYEDAIDGYDDENTDNVCYYVVARAELTLPGGETRTIFSRSNTYCVQQNVRIRVPNAFIPSGINTHFKPALVFGETASFWMRIYNRNGAMIFETQDAETGWDGSTNGNPVPQGVYVYHIRITQLDGQVADRRGTVMLIR